MSLRVILADDHALVRAGIKALLEAMPDIEVTAEASHGREAVEAADRLRPDIVIMDVAMPELNGLEATARITRHVPGVRVIMLSMMANE